ncbi:phosphate uptake regulator PhoU [Halomicroarcula sp. S1AR25-4]|uniref:Histidine kinase n=2 Tax=Haloarculaceae TaxID=1963268 RepID=A0A830GR88_9EURY|nr:phosphate uptake regulator PhoU [Halomicroarcula pellucida]MDS0277748.1 phosphate uptake regulator PhoU [Halomicroarcula sp. S1AR25-4]GGO00645.1 histidine kinase [Halomicroarcula pellucida]
MTPDAVRMKRKVQQLGSSTLAVTVPAEWARHHDIEKGDEIIVQRDENGGSLLLVPEQPSIADVEATVDADALTSDALERAIVTQYVLGRQLIRIEATTPLGLEHRNAVLGAERRLMGLGIVEQAETTVTVRCSVAPGDFDLPTLLGRLSRTEAAIRSDAVTALLDGDPEAAEQVSARKGQVEKLFYLFLRLVFATYRNPRLNQAVGLETGFPLIGYRSVAQDVVLMADVAVEIATLAAEGDGTVPDATTAEVVTDLAEALDEAASATRAAVTTPDYEGTETAREAFDRVDECVAAANDHLAAERPEPLLVLQRAVTLLERSARHARDSLSVATHLAFREDPDLVTSE